MKKEEIITPTETEIEQSLYFGRSITNFIWGRCRVDPGLEFGTCMYSMFLKSLSVLKSYGWDKSTLIKTINKYYKELENSTDYLAVENSIFENRRNED
jgi:hypothetical protein